MGRVLNSSQMALEEVSSLKAELKRAVVAATGNCGHARIGTGRKCHCTIPRFNGNISHIKRSVNDVPSSTSATNCGAAPNRTCVCKAPTQRCEKTKPSSERFWAECRCPF